MGKRADLGEYGQHLQEVVSRYRAEACAEQQAIGESREMPEFKRTGMEGYGDHLSQVVAQNRFVEVRTREILTAAGRE